MTLSYRNSLRYFVSYFVPFVVKLLIFTTKGAKDFTKDSRKIEAKYLI